MNDYEVDKQRQRQLCRSTVERLHSRSIAIVHGRTENERIAVQGRMPLLQPQPDDPNHEEMLADLHQTVPGMNWAEHYVVSVDKVRADSECTKQHAHCPWCMNECSQFDGNAVRLIKHHTSGNPIMRVCMKCSIRKQMYTFSCCYYGFGPMICCNCIMKNWNFATPHEHHDPNAPALPLPRLQPPAVPAFDPSYESDESE
jgi:hypothetical protein